MSKYNFRPVSTREAQILTAIIVITFTLLMILAAVVS